MKVCMYAIFCLLLLAVASAQAAWIPVTSTVPGEPCRMQVTQDGAQSWQISVDVSGIDAGVFSDGMRIFDVLDLPGETAVGESGEAALPAISRLVGLRFDGDPQIELLAEEWMDLPGDYRLPADDAASPALSSDYATRDEFLPHAAFVVSPRQVMGGVGLAVVQVRAIQYNPAEHRVRVLRSASLRLTESGALSARTRPITETTASLLRNQLPNWGQMALDDIVVRGTFLYVLAKDTLSNNGIQQLITWRKRQGHTVETAGPAQIGSPLSTTNIKNYLQTRYNAANPPLEYICLVGDANGTYLIPAYTYTFEGNSGVGDYDFARLDGNDLMPDVAIGRLPFDNASDLQKLVNKTLRYERTPSAPSGASHPDWYKGGGCFAGSGSGISPVQTMRTVRARMLDAGFTATSIDTVYWNSGSIGPTEMNASINAGVSLWCYRGYLGMSGYTTSDPAALTNLGRWPFMLNLTCGTNDYNGSSYDLCESLLLPGTASAPTGAVAICGMSSIHTNTRYNNALMTGAVQGLLIEGVRSTGASLERAKLEVWRSYPADSAVGRVTFFMGITTLLGEPAIDVFTNTPDSLFVNNPSTLPVGANTLTLTVTNGLGQSVEGAYVNLLKGSEVFTGAWSDALGHVTLNFVTTTTDSLFVTATKHNYKPAAAYSLVSNSTGYVAPASGAFLLNDDNVAPSQGNNDSLANPGETIELSLPLKNWGTVAASGVNATLSITDLRATVLAATQSYGTVNAGATVSPAAPFVFSLASTIPDGATLQFVLTVTDNAAHTWTSSVPVRVVNGNLEYSSNTVQNAGNGILDPGESGQIYLTLTNAGHRATAANATAWLRSLSSVVVVTDSVGAFPAAPVGGSTNNSANPFGLTATAGAFPGERVPFMVIFPEAAGYADTVLFNLVIGTVTSSSPTPCDAYGYWAFDDTDVGYTRHPTYNWVEVDPRYGGLGTALPLVDNSEDADMSTVAALPFPFQYYGQTFTEITVCTNGWLAMGADQVVHSDFRNYAIPSAPGPSRMIAPFWDDLLVPPVASSVEDHGGHQNLDQGNDACPATVIPSIPYTDTGTTTGRANDYTATTCPIGAAADVIYQFTPTATGSYTVSLCGSSYDTGLMVRTGGACPGTTQVNCNDDFSSCGTSSQISMTMNAGVTYYIIVDGYGSNSGAYSLSLTTTPVAGVCTYYDAVNHRFIIEWSRVQKFDGSAPYSEETFECMLYEPGYPATPTGDGEILFQYLTCNNTTDDASSNDYCTVGIENLDNTDGVMYSYWNMASPQIPGAAVLAAGRAILFTTQKLPVDTPAVPTEVVATGTSSSVTLLWRSVQTDIHGAPLPSVQYKVYRGTDASFVPGVASLIATVGDTTYTDATISGQRYYYLVQAVSPAGSLSASAPSAPPRPATR